MVFYLIRLMRSFRLFRWSCAMMKFCVPILYGGGVSFQRCVMPSAKQASWRWNVVCWLYGMPFLALVSDWVSTMRVALLQYFLYHSVEVMFAVKQSFASGETVFHPLPFFRWTRRILGSLISSSVQSE